MESFPDEIQLNGGLAEIGDVPQCNERAMDGRMTHPTQGRSGAAHATKMRSRPPWEYTLNRGEVKIGSKISDRCRDKDETTSWSGSRRSKYAFRGVRGKAGFGRRAAFGGKAGFSRFHAWLPSEAKGARRKQMAPEGTFLPPHTSARGARHRVAARSTAVPHGGLPMSEAGREVCSDVSSRACTKRERGSTRGLLMRNTLTTHACNALRACMRYQPAYTPGGCLIFIPTPV